MSVTGWLSTGDGAFNYPPPGDHSESLLACGVGIDCPLGWPDTFVEFLNAHHGNQLLVPEGVPSADWQRSLAYCGTDE